MCLRKSGLKSIWWNIYEGGCLGGINTVKGDVVFY